ncbi:ParA family protein [Fastidiosibacter lacustris]|uniref:ParA family protein n=1 Tax=Fastidiosibacter lacustris TaxID=2056695 RepID=UPI000E3424AC|nr:ParA family protein [Fastidiosibacter lacustris]
MKTAKVIALLQQKGGSGKTTTAMNIYGGLKELGHNVLVIDMDKDKPDAWSWAAKSESLADSVIQVDEKHARETITEIKSKADFIVIDTPPNFQTAALKAALLADLVIIPSAPSGMDLSGLLEAKDLALTADRPYRLLGNRVMKGSNMSRSLLKVLEEEGKSFSTYIPQSVKFVEAEASGMYIGDYAPESNVHIQVRRLAKEIVAFFVGVSA